MRSPFVTITMLLIAAFSAPVQSQSGTYALRQLTPETAAKATRAALDDCRKRGYQVAVAVVDRFEKVKEFLDKTFRALLK